ncbi:hypothetical protein ACHAPE_007320 [Trichoderma viride]
MLKRAGVDPNISEAELNAIASETLNGRQIKNVVKAANLPVAGEDTTLDMEHVKIVLQVMRLRHVPEEKDPLRAISARMQAMHQIRHKVSFYANSNEEEASQTSWVSMLLHPMELVFIKCVVASDTSQSSRKDSRE